ncbi:MAG TPA: DNA-3-methyladenine glycosylase [Gemmatimonadales bacterium]|nr:DNA-3-methyladenine glycosylase [Gemmatimonadales bacterium]
MSPRSRAAKALPVSFFARPVETVARELLGTVMVSVVQGTVTAGRIVETEAYLGRDDPASHGYRLRRNARNQSLYGPPGTWYVYLSYGMHWCANLVCQVDGIGAAILVRALEPLEGLEQMRSRRGGVADRLIASGPGKLCQALGITRALDGALMPRSTVTVLTGGLTRDEPVQVTPRIGITKAVEWPLRFVVAGSPWVSKVGKR